MTATSENPRRHRSAAATKHAPAERNDDNPHSHSALLELLIRELHLVPVDIQPLAEGR